MANRIKLEQLIRRLIDAKREYGLLAFDRELSYKLGPPCTEAQLRRLENLIGAPLPPSYRKFLELHNGWEGFDGVAKLLAVEDHDELWVKERVRTFETLLEEYGEDNPFKRGAVPVVLGQDSSGFTLLDPTTVRKSGEMSFLMFNNVEELDRFEDFMSFLEDDLEQTLELIREQREGIGDEEVDEDEEF